MNDTPGLATLYHDSPSFTRIPKKMIVQQAWQGARGFHPKLSPTCFSPSSVLCRDDYGHRLAYPERSLRTVSKARVALGYSSDADDEDDELFFPPPTFGRPSLMDNNSLSPETRPNGLGRRRRSAASITERVTAIVSLRRGSTSATRSSRSRAGSDLSNGARQDVTNSSNVTTPRTEITHENSTCTTEDDLESSEEIHSIDESSEFGLLDDPFANLTAPPSEFHSPSSRLWFRSLSSDVIREEPEDFNDKSAKSISIKRSHSENALQVLNNCKTEEVENDGDISILTQERDDEQRSRSVDAYERKRTKSLTQRVRNMVQSRPSLPSLSLLANTKIFLPASASKSVLASRFPSEPWDDPKYTTDPANHIRTASSQKGSSRSGGYGGGDRYGHFDYSAEDGRSPAHSPHHRAGGGGGGGAGGHGRDGRQPPNRSGDSRTTSEDNTTTEENTSTSSSDDLPLGQRPNALKAQKSLRMQIKDERRSRKETIKPVSRPTAELSTSPQTRGGHTLADDLTARLLRLRPTTPSGSLPPSPNGRTAFPTLPSQSKSRPTSSSGHGHTSPHSPLHGQFQPSHYPPFRPSTRPSTAQNDTSSSSQIPASSLAFPSSSNSAPLKRHVTDSHTHNTYIPDPRPRMPDRSMTSFDSPRSGVASPSYPESRRPSLAYDSSPAPPTRVRADTLMQKLRSPSLPTPTKLRARANSLHTSKAAVPPPLPPLPVPAQEGSSQMMQQRIFIGDLQRYSVIEIGARTNAREVLSMIEAKGDLSGEEMRDGDWMLFEMANDFGMERPIREFELVMEIYNSWNSDMRVNYFMLKRTPLASFLAADAIPKSSPTHGGYVEWEHKRGKWTKRWLELREHSLWISKRQGAKDAAVLCTLSNFDAYLVTRLHKSPKPFVFSIKSVQNMRLFERAQDYHHVFSCEAVEGREWWHNILLARSYVLHQERTVLFHQFAPKPTVRVPARSTTRRVPPTPLLNVPVSTSPLSPIIPKTPNSPLAAPDAFQPMPGSLLAKRV